MAERNTQGQEPGCPPVFAGADELAGTELETKHMSTNDNTSKTDLTTVIAKLQLAEAQTLPWALCDSQEEVGKEEGLAEAYRYALGLLGAEPLPEEVSASILASSQANLGGPSLVSLQAELERVLAAGHHPMNLVRRIEAWVKVEGDWAGYQEGLESIHRAWNE